MRSKPVEKRNPKNISFVALGLLLLVAPAEAWAEKHALLVGIGKYAHIPQLEGPPHDVQALKSLLIRSWGFAPEKVTTLVDAQATKGAILEALDGLIRVTGRDDRVFIYYSGHGTSVHDESLGEQIGFGRNTGAILPVDFRLGSSVDEMSSALIVGSRDLRRRMEQLDRDRKVFVVFDTCYSGSSIRSVWPNGAPKYIRLELGATKNIGSTRSSGAPFDVFGEFGSQTSTEEEYPYRNIIYFSAASRSEVAYDISKLGNKAGHKTTDGKPHGAFTNGLLQGMSGSADTNGDGMVSYEELYQHAKGWTMSRFPQHPQAYPRSSSTELLAPLFGQKSIPSASSDAAENTVLRTRLEMVEGELARKVSGISGIRVVEEDYDVLVASKGDTYSVFDSSGDIVACYSTARTNELLERLRRQVSVHSLLNRVFPDKKFNVWLDLIDPERKGSFRVGERIGFSVYPESDSYVLLLNVDLTGHVSVFYPYTPEEMAQVAGGRSLLLKDLGVVGTPTGAEYMKVFAFRQRPRGLDAWVGRSFSPTDPQFGEMLEMLRSAEGDMAEAKLKVVTLGGASACR